MLRARCGRRRWIRTYDIGGRHQSWPSVMSVSRPRGEREDETCSHRATLFQPEHTNAYAEVHGITIYHISKSVPEGFELHVLPFDHRSRAHDELGRVPERLMRSDTLGLGRR